MKKVLIQFLEKLSKAVFGNNAKLDILVDVVPV
jgi:hypothetical protein